MDHVALKSISATRQLSIANSYSTLSGYSLYNRHGHRQLEDCAALSNHWIIRAKFCRIVGTFESYRFQVLALQPDIHACYIDPRVQGLGL